ncbi:hypothetical protein CSW77_26105, partial [Shigella flexneri]
WQSGEDSMVTRISLDTGRHATVPITKARAIDDSGGEHFDVFPTSDETTLTYLFGAEDPDDPMSQAFSRAAELTLPAGLKETDSATLAADSGPNAATMEDTTDPMCSTDGSPGRTPWSHGSPWTPGAMPLFPSPKLERSTT